jgi:hypothetical protein
MNNEYWKSENWVIRENWLKYKSNYVISRKHNSNLVLLIKKICALRYLFIFDVVFFNFGSTLFSPEAYVSSNSIVLNIKSKLVFYLNSVLQRFELFVLKIRKIPILIQYQGDDARQAEWCKKNQSICIANEVGSDYYPPGSDKHKIQQIALLEKYCDKIFSLNPDLLHVLPRNASFLPYSHINLEEWVDSPRVKFSENMRIGHAPTNRAGKGSKYIINAVEELKNRGYNIDFVLIEGLDNKTAREVYRSLDIFVDQLLAGWYGGVAVELMALGKPVVSYVREDDLHFIPIEMCLDLPIIQATPETIAEVLEKLLNTPKREIGMRGEESRKFVEKWHNPISVSNQILKEIEKQISIKYGH